MLAISALVLTGCTSSEVIPFDDNADSLSGDLTTQITDAVTAGMALSKSTQAVVGVWSADGELVEGFATEGAPGDFDANALFRGAQTTQPVMCALLLDMVNTGEVKLDREVAQDLPRQTGIGDVTYRQLCDGTSGLPDFKPNIQDIYVTNPTRAWATGELIAESLVQDELSWPGLDVHRSDANAVLLGRALAVVASTDLDELLLERVFLPAGMNSTSYPEDEQFTVPGDNVLTGTAYLPGPQCDADPVDLAEQSSTMLGAAGATFTNAGDLKRFYESYLSGAFGGTDASIITETRSTTNPERDENGEPTSEPEESLTHRGFGVVQLGPLWGFDGALPGTISTAWHNPDTGFTVVVALNNSTAGAGFATTLARQIAAIMGESGDAWTAEEMAETLAALEVCPAEEDAE